MLQIRLLGQFDVRLDGKRVVISSRASQSLLAYLALTAGTAHRREKLAGIFWPDVSEEKARAYLRHELWRLRKAVPAQELTSDDNYLLADEYTLTFNPRSDYWLDVAMLERPESDLQSLTSSLSLYQGELLPGFYEDWILLERGRLQTLFESKMEQLVEKLVDAERWTAVEEQCERWLALGHGAEPAYRALMLSYNARGDMAKVSSTYQRCVEDLKDHFGVEPSAETHALFNGLLKGAKVPRRIMPAQPSGTVTFLFTDIQGSTRLLDKLGEQYATSLAEHHRILRLAIQKWKGSEMDTQGDAFFVTFTRALDAVQCAAEAQRMLANHEWPLDEPIRVRMGLHTGEPLIASTGYVGMDVHRAARIGDAGHGGQVLLSQTTRELVIQDLPAGVTIKDLGEHRLKDMKYPTPIYQLVIEGLQADFPPLKTKFTGSEAPVPGEPPFKGLQYFDEIDSDLFFGRELLTAKLVNRLRDTQFLSVVIGASGSGKSSLVRAGLIPALKKGGTLLDGTKAPEGSTDWQIHIITPTAHPLEALATELTRDLDSLTATARLIDDLAQEPRSLALFFVRTGSRRHTVLVVDQFEELFTLCRDEFEREAFIDNLLTAISPSPVGRGARGEGNITLIITLRADFYAHLAQYPELRDAVAQQQEYIGPMTAEDLRRAIEEPARRGHWEFEPGLVDLILRDVGDEPGALPLLSHALLETWKRRAGHTLTLKGYANAGGVHGAIAHTAETIYRNLSSEEQAIARDIFLRLTELGEGTEDTRRRVSFEELTSSTEDSDHVRAVLNKLAEARLLTLGENTVEVAHEALIREWPTLREWLNQDREGLRLHRHLTEASYEWELLGRDPGALYRGAHLVQAREWAALHPSALNAGERAFLTNSVTQEEQEQQEREAQQQRELEAARRLAETESRRAEEQVRAARGLRRLAAGLVIFLVAAIGAAWFAFNQSKIAQNNFVAAERIRLASQAQIALDNGEGGDLPALLAMRSLHLGYSPEADAALLNALSRGFTRQRFLGHTDLLLGVAFSPNGDRIATASQDGTARLWDIQTGQELRQFAPPVRIVTSVVFAPDGRNVLIGSSGPGAYLWDTETNREVRQFIGHSGGLYAGDFSPDGKFLVTYDEQMVRLWDVLTGRQLRQFVGHTPGPSWATFSPDGHSIATVGGDGTARLWDVRTGREDSRLKTDPNPVYAEYSPDGQYLLTVSGKIVQLWEIQTGLELRRFVGHADWIFEAKFSPDGGYMLTGSNDKTARLWDVSTGQELRQFIGHTSGVGPVAYSPDGKSVLTGSDDRTVRLWAVWPETEPRRFNTFSMVGGDIATFAGTQTTALSPDSKYVLNFLAGEGRGEGVALWNTQTGERRDLRLELTTDMFSIISAMALSPENNYLLGGGVDGAVWLWDAQTGKNLHEFPGHLGPVRIVTLSSDGRLLLTGGDDKTARLWDAQTGQQLHVFLGHSGPIRAVAFSPDGQFILTGSEDQIVRLWDVNTGKEISQFAGHKAPVRAVAFSPDGEFILTGGDDQTSRLWEVQTGQELRQFIGHTAQVSQVTFSPDSQYALTGSADQTARLWDINTGTQLRQFTGHLSAVLYLGFLDNEHSVVTGDSQSAIVWRTNLDDVIAFTCTQLTRDLSPEERTLYNISDQASTCIK